MTNQIIEIRIEAEDVPLFDRLVAQYGQGDPSKFLTYAIRKISADRLRLRMQILQAEAREDLKGKVFSSQETMRIIRKVLKRDSN
jgi:hypothetical protein